MFVREFGLVPNRDDSERYVRLVRWEERWVPKGDMEAKTLVPVAWEFRMLARLDPERGISWQAPVPVAITELRMRQLKAPTWPREANHEESEELRRSRIRLLRKACHVDADKGKAEPRWISPAEKAAIKVLTLSKSAKSFDPMTEMDDVDDEVAAYEASKYEALHDAVA